VNWGPLLPYPSLPFSFFLAFPFSLCLSLPLSSSFYSFYPLYFFCFSPFFRSETPKIELGGQVERCKLLQRGPERSPIAEITVQCDFKIWDIVATILIIFLQNQLTKLAHLMQSKPMLMSCLKSVPHVPFLGTPLLRSNLRRQTSSYRALWYIAL